MGWGLPLPARACSIPSSLITRVEESNSKLLESERKLQEERHRTVVLEQHLEKIRLEPGKASASQRAAPRTKTGRGQGSSLSAGGGGSVAANRGARQLHCSAHQCACGKQSFHQGGALPASTVGCSFPRASQSEAGAPELHCLVWPWPGHL